MTSEVTRILSLMEAGDPTAAESLLPLVYDELRRLAAARLAQEKPGQTLQATALVHEAYLRLVGNAPGQQWNSRGHFFGAAAEAMRRILVEQARRKQSLKQGGGWIRHSLPLDGVSAAGEPEEILAIDEALHRLVQQHPQVARVVELRYFAGLSMEEIAAALDLSERTIHRYWTFAKAWLMEEFRDSTAS